MINEYALFFRDKNGNICGGQSHDKANFLTSGIVDDKAVLAIELSVLKRYLEGNIPNGAHSVEIHKMLPEETLSQLIERINVDHLKPITSINKSDLNLEEAK